MQVIKSGSGITHAEKLGMANTHFINSHGLDTDEHYTTPRDNTS